MTDDTMDQLTQLAAKTARLEFHLGRLVEAATSLRLAQTAQKAVHVAILNDLAAQLDDVLLAVEEEDW